MADVISFSCNFCGTPFRVPFAQAGKTVKCTHCNRTITVPTQSQSISAPNINDTSVQMNAGEQVLRKQTSARSAPTGRITSSRLAAVPSGRTAKIPSGRAPAAEGPPAVTPIVPVAAPSAKGASIGIILGIGVVALAVISLVVVFAWPKERPPNQVANNVPDKDPPRVPESERDKILRAYDSAILTSADAVALLNRARAAKLPTADMVHAGRITLNKLADENGGSLTSDQLLSLAAELSPLGLPGEAARICRLVADREPEGSDAFVRAQKQLGRERFDFSALAARTTALINAGQEGAEEIRDGISGIEKQSAKGWVERDKQETLRALIEKLGQAEKALQELEKSNPNLVIERTALNKFRKERAGQRGKWACAGSPPFIFFMQLTEREAELPAAEGESNARERTHSLRKMALRMAEYFTDNFVKPLGLKRSLPQDVAEAERASRPLEIMMLRDLRALRSFASDINEHMEGETCFLTLKGNRVCIDADSWEQPASRTSTELRFGHLVFMNLFNYHRAEPFLKDTDFNKHGMFQCTLLKRSLMRCILTPWRADAKMAYYQVQASAEQQHLEECVFLESISGLGRLLHRWRQPYARSGPNNRNLDSFGAAALSVRDMIEARDESDLSKRVVTNLSKVKEMEAGLADQLGAGTNFQRVSYAYSDALVLFLHHFERNGSFVYREGLLKLIAKELSGETAKVGALKAFEDAFSMSPAKWKQIEEDFAESQK